MTGFDDHEGIAMRPCTKAATIASLLACGLQLGTPALAKDGMALKVFRPSTPAHAGRPWSAVLRLTLRGKPYARAGYRPTLTISDAGYRFAKTFDSVPTGKAGNYRVRVVFPHAGLWKLGVPDPIMGDWYFPERVGA
jgi:hypothetical protein